MRPIVAITQVTLDGIMQSPGGREEDPTNGFSHGGWAMAYGDDVLHEEIGQTISGAFDMLLGRRTYEIFAAYWPEHGDNPIGQAFNAARKYVATHSLDHLGWENAHIVGGDAVAQIRRLKEGEGPALHVWGSSELLQTLIAAGLVDEFRLWVFPVVLGKGKRLFGDGIPPAGLMLVSVRATARGVVLATYRPAGAIAAEGGA